MTWEISDRTVLVTGGTGGIGYHTARALAQRGAQVVVNGRDAGLAAAVADRIAAETGRARVEPVVGDLASIVGVRAVAGQMRERHDRLDVLVNNAGLLAGERRLTADGVEAHFAVNVLAPWVLSHELAPLLARAGSSRVVNLTGGASNRKVVPRNLQAERFAPGLTTYSRAKAAMEALSMDLADELGALGAVVAVVYPGGATTAMTAAMTPAMLPAPMRLFWPIFSRLQQRPDDGRSARRASRSSVHAASVSELGRAGALVFLDTRARRHVRLARVSDDDRRAVRAEVDRITPEYARAPTTP